MTQADPLVQVTGTQPAAREPGRVVRLASYVVLVVLTAQLTVLGAVLLLWRPGGVSAPVGIALAALVGPAVWRGASLLGSRRGALGPGVAWLGLVLPMMYQRREGDLVVQSDGAGMLFLLVGTLGAAICAGAWAPGASLAALVRRRSPRGGLPAP